MLISDGFLEKYNFIIWFHVQTGARAGGGAAKAAYGGVYTATTAATSYPTQAYSQPAQQQPKRKFTIKKDRHLLYRYLFVYG